MMPTIADLVLGQFRPCPSIDLATPVSFALPGEMDGDDEKPVDVFARPDGMTDRDYLLQIICRNGGPMLASDFEEFGFQRGEASAILHSLNKKKKVKFCGGKRSRVGGRSANLFMASAP